MKMSYLTLGVIGRSRKENERRVPIHPRHFPQIPDALRGHIIVEEGYGERFELSDRDIANELGHVMPREKVFEHAEIVLLPKPLPEDLRAIRDGGVHWGWPHCVQQPDITQAAIDKRLTLVAWEAMFTWKDDDVKDMHLFYRNNEMAGYCGVLHALDIVGADGLYGPKLKAVVLSLGSVSRGAIYGLQARGIFDITVYTQRPVWAVHDEVTGCRYGQMVPDERGGNITVKDQDGERRKLRDVLAGTDIIVNGILQDTDNPLTFVDEDDARSLKPRTLIIDVSCDEGMGFPFARPTTFERPTVMAGHVYYYAVDHTPSYLWRSASWEISRVVVPFLETVMSGSDAWAADATIDRAIEIRDGVIQNPKILSFQNRSADYPHRRPH